MPAFTHLTEDEFREAQMWLRAEEGGRCCEALPAHVLRALVREVETTKISEANIDSLRMEVETLEDELAAIERELRDLRLKGCA